MQKLFFSVQSTQYHPYQSTINVVLIGLLLTHHRLYAFLIYVQLYPSPRLFLHSIFSTVNSQNLLYVYRIRYIYRIEQRGYNYRS